MQIRNATIDAVTVRVPSRVVTRDDIQRIAPDVIEDRRAASIKRMFARSQDESLQFQAMRPYLEDPLRGLRHKHYLAEGETTVGLEAAAAGEALELLSIKPEEVDLLISAGFTPDNIGIGNAVHVAGELGIKGAAWNVETACAGAIVGLQIASNFVRSGEYDCVVVTTSCAYSTRALDHDPTSWFLGDGAGAFVVRASDREGFGYLGANIVHSANTCGTYDYELQTINGQPRVVMTASPTTGKVLTEQAPIQLREVCGGALTKAGLELADVDFFVFHSPVAWFADFCASTLGIDRSRTLSTFPAYGNVGPVLGPANLHFGLISGRIGPGDTVLVYGPGTAASCAASIFRLGEVATNALASPAREVLLDDHSSSVNASDRSLRSPSAP